MLSGEDDAVVADPQPPVRAAGQCDHLPGKRCGVLGILLDLGDDALSIACGEATHVSDRPAPLFDLHLLIHSLHFRK